MVLLSCGEVKEDRASCDPTVDDAMRIILSQTMLVKLLLVEFVLEYTGNDLPTRF